jgi:hypothetical protein
MVQSGWDIVCDYYQNPENAWVPYSIMNVDPNVARGTRVTGTYGSLDFEVSTFIYVSQ